MISCWGQKRAGFSLIEVWISMLILALLIGAASSAILTIEQSERASARLEDAMRMSSALISELARTRSGTNLIATAGAMWIITAHTQETGASTNPTRWQVWEIAPADRPSAAWRLAMIDE